MEKYVISMYDKGQNEAGPKAKIDVEDILVAQGFKRLNFYFSGARKAKVISLRQRAWDIPQKIKKIQPELVIFQYPTFDQMTDRAILKALRRYTRAKIVFLIHDVESLRTRRADRLYQQTELDFLAQGDGLIVHNEKMKQWFKEHKITKPLVSLEIFDYLNPVALPKEHHFERTLCYAGNLQKADFLQKLSLTHKMSLFGSNPKEHYPTALSYEGSFAPDELPKKLTQDLGLIWDGTSLERCDGVYGEYLKYNDPHKTSLYLSSGLPVIIWQEAALADFVAQNKVGLCVADLTELDERLTGLEQAEYEQMWHNTQLIAQKMRQGEYLKTAVQKICEQIEVKI